MAIFVAMPFDSDSIHQIVLELIHSTAMRSRTFEVVGERDLILLTIKRRLRLAKHPLFLVERVRVGLNRHRIKLILVRARAYQLRNVKTLKLCR
jgi:hypothetical protein